ncbi:hypothetical protein KUTeg_009888 [Tegillarca granosa]|uniref:PiggyBac transposable element-derived protein domain-containing protein n=1 Tax=Tegillarca granosa TaxID=220873 RepID=A0ABQ9F563_TEGGR|nr:hypothetical protein KUTeg_009888 [Tegillarca granosa]
MKRNANEMDFAKSGMTLDLTSSAVNVIEKERSQGLSKRKRGTYQASFQQDLGATFAGKKSPMEIRLLENRQSLDALTVVNICVYHSASLISTEKGYTGVNIFVELLTDLHIRGILACGTVRSNRKHLPIDLLPAKLNLQKHQYIVAQKDCLTYSVWMDTKPVVTLSNFHDPSDFGVVNRPTAGGQVRVPKLLSDYKLYMKGVNLADQMIGYYLLNHRSKSGGDDCFLFHACLSYVIAKDSNFDHVMAEWSNFQDFIENLSEELIGNTRSKREQVVEVPNRASVHNIVKLFPKRKRCYECRLTSRQGQRSAVGINHNCSKTTKLVIGALASCNALNKGHKVYTDNYYTRPELCEELDLCILVKSLISTAILAPKPSGRGGRKSQPIDRLIGMHLPQHIPVKVGVKKVRAQRDCIACNPEASKRQLSDTLADKPRTCLLSDETSKFGEKK